MRKIPNHLAIIMDGNGRFAKERGLPRSFGHKAGSENVKKIALSANRLGVKYLTLFAFSSENWKRPQSEIEYLFKLPKIFFSLYLKELMDNNIRIDCIGIIEQFPKEMKEVIEDAIFKTRNNTGLTLCFALNYGSKQEIVFAARCYARACLEEDKLIDLDEESFNTYFLKPDYPFVDLLIRTSGELRVSNFLLWQIAYAEFVFVDKHWPDFDENLLLECIDEYTKRDRRFGGLNVKE